MSDRFVVISGCSGAGKSTLLGALAASGLQTIPEPGRRVVEAELRGDGALLPWNDLAGFARRAIDLAVADRVAASSLRGWVFFDRGIVDAAVALDHATGGFAAQSLAAAHRYHRRVFLAPPWPAIYVSDAERPHGLAEAVAEYDRLAEAYPRLGYEVVTLPRLSVADRMAFVLRLLGPSSD